MDNESKGPRRIDSAIPTDITLSDDAARKLAKAPKLDVEGIRARVRARQPKVTPAA